MNLLLRCSVFRRGCCRSLLPAVYVHLDRVLRLQAVDAAWNTSTVAFVAADCTVVIRLPLTGCRLSLGWAVALRSNRSFGSPDCRMFAASRRRKSLNFTLSVLVRVFDTLVDAARAVKPVDRLIYRK